VGRLFILPARGRLPHRTSVGRRLWHPGCAKGCGYRFRNEPLSQVRLSAAMRRFAHYCLYFAPKVRCVLDRQSLCPRLCLSRAYSIVGRFTRCFPRRPSPCPSICRGVGPEGGVPPFGWATPPPMATTDIVEGRMVLFRNRFGRWYEFVFRLSLGLCLGITVPGNRQLWIPRNPFPHLASHIPASCDYFRSQRNLHNTLFFSFFCFPAPIPVMRPLLEAALAPWFALQVRGEKGVNSPGVAA